MHAVTLLPQKLTGHFWHYQLLPPEDTPLSPEAARVKEHWPEVGGGGPDLAPELQARIPERASRVQWDQGWQVQNLWKQESRRVICSGRFVMSILARFHQSVQAEHSDKEGGRDTWVGAS